MATRAARWLASSARSAPSPSLRTIRRRGRLHLDLDVEVEGQGQDVEAGAEVGRRGGGPGAHGVRVVRWRRWVGRESRRRPARAGDRQLRARHRTRSTADRGRPGRPRPGARARVPAGHDQRLARRAGPARPAASADGGGDHRHRAVPGEDDGRHPLRRRWRRGTEAARGRGRRRRRAALVGRRWRMPAGRRRVGRSPRPARAPAGRPPCRSAGQDVRQPMAAWVNPDFTPTMPSVPTERRVGRHGARRWAG